MFRLTLALLACAALFPATLPAQDDLDKQLRSIISAYSIAAENAADPVNSEQAFYGGAIPAMLRKLDPHSIFFDPGQFDQLKRMESSTSKGFGSVVSILPGRVIVLQTVQGTPSQKAGLSPGDEILAINGYVIATLDIEQLPQLLEQSRQQQARLDVRRPGVPSLMHFTLTPEEMQSPSVDRAFFIGAGVGYIRVTSFDEKTAAQVKAAIEKLGGARRSRGGSAQQSRRRAHGRGTDCIAIPATGDEDRHGARTSRAGDHGDRADHRHAVRLQTRRVDE
jgi:carboxyl-terminal processing protease